MWGGLRRASLPKVGVANKTRNRSGAEVRKRSDVSAATYLAKLNPEQRLAVEHGAGASTPSGAGPLLVIAGADSGKTNTLAHRVAHLVVSGADPRRIMLLTFSRRAASEMRRRVERICGQALGASAGVMTDALSWRILADGRLTRLACPLK